VIPLSLVTDKHRQKFTHSIAARLPTDYEKDGR
jgi:hypothetical protein